MRGSSITRIKSSTSRYLLILVPFALILMVKVVYSPTSSLSIVNSVENKKTTWISDDDPQYTLPAYITDLEEVKQDLSEKKENPSKQLTSNAKPVQKSPPSNTDIKMKPEFEKQSEKGAETQKSEKIPTQTPLETHEPTEQKSEKVPPQKQTKPQKSEKIPTQRPLETQEPTEQKSEKVPPQKQTKPQISEKIPTQKPLETQEPTEQKSEKVPTQKPANTVEEWRRKEGVLYNTSNPYPGACDGRNTTEEFCNRVYTTPGNSTRNYNIHLVSGCPGSGNDWILWLGSVIGYEKDQQNLLNHCEVAGYRTWKWKQPNGEWGSMCPYLKTHEPYFDKAPWQMIYGTKATIILRHPFDAAFSEYKRQMVLTYLRSQKTNSELRASVKNSVAGLKESDFFSLDHKILNGSRWTNHALYSMDKWVEHATFWIQQWNKPLIPLIYNDFKTNTDTQLPQLLNYFQFTPDEYTADKYCCVLKHPFNPNLKRGATSIDKYKDFILENTPGLSEKTKQAVKTVQDMIDKRWPGLKIVRG